MRHRLALPSHLGEHFSVRQASAAGVGRGRAAASDLARPFHGARAIDAPGTPLQRVQALAPLLRPGQLIGGATALHVWGYPHPSAWTVADPISVVVRTGTSRPRTNGVTGMRLAADRVQAWNVAGLPIVDPLTALFMCANELTDVQLVVLLDAIITDRDNYPDVRHGRPVLTVHDIEQKLATWKRFPGCARIRAALSRTRAQVDSPKETETRLSIVAAGLPEPVVQFEVTDDGELVARIDLAYPQWRIAIEYEGDGHRTSRDQWRRDIQRQRDLEDRGWIVIRITQLDLDDGAEALLTRLRRAIASRS